MLGRRCAARRHCTRIWRSRATIWGFSSLSSFSSFGGEGWGEEAPCQCCRSDNMPSGCRTNRFSARAENDDLLPMNLGLPERCRQFPLSPAEGERVAERGPT